VAIEYAVKLTPLRPSGSLITLPAVADITYGVEAASLTFSDPLTDLRPTLEALGAKKRIEQQRTSDDVWIIWTAQTGVVPVQIEVEEVNAWTAVKRSKTFKAVLQMPQYRWSVNAESFSLLAYYAYLIIGLDMDSYALKGGSFYLQRAQEIVNLVPQNNEYSVGWRSADNLRNR
jgi:hypothetical protein